MKFSDFDFCPELIEVISKAGFSEPTPVQQEAIPMVLSSKDLIAQAQTGTGKTAAFGLPLIEKIKQQEFAKVLVIVPTRELGHQVSDELYRFGQALGIKSATVSGGAGYDRQIQRANEADFVVATPGRLKDLLSSGKLKLNVDVVVLDEADEMLNMGFLPEIKAIFDLLPSPKQRLMFSATMPTAIRKLANSILVEPQTLTITQENTTNEAIDQRYCVARFDERDEATLRLLSYFGGGKSIIFCQTKKEVDRLQSMLGSKGFRVTALHGDMEQRQRQNSIGAFKHNRVDIMVATDVAARGIDISNVSHVFNIGLPFDTQSYVHRIGRTARGGKKGMAISLIGPKEIGVMRSIIKETKADIEPMQIPSLLELNERQSQQLLSQIAQSKIDKNAEMLLEALTSEIDIQSAALLLCAHILEGKKLPSGQENIGMTISQINKLQSFDNQGGHGRRGRGGNRNGRNRGGNRNRNFKPNRDKNKRFSR